MKSLALKLTLILTTIFFTACSNMQVGFEEDSPFYTPPSEKNLGSDSKAIDAKEPVEKVTAKKEHEISTTTSKEQEVQPIEKVDIAQDTKKEVVEETETTFSYSREDGE